MIDSNIEYVRIMIESVLPNLSIILLRQQVLHIDI